MGPTMKRLSIVLPMTNILVFGLIGVAFVQAHGGWSGDVVPGTVGNDVISQPADMGLAFFNRWNFSEHESAATRGFMLANIVAFGVARLILDLVRAFWSEFRGNYPFGLSYASYSLMLAFPLSLLQWYGVGLLVDRLRKRFAH